MRRLSLLGLLAVGGISALVACSGSSTTNAQPSGDDAGDPDAAVADDDASSADGGGGGSCSSARDTFLVPVAKVSTGEVSVLGDSGGVKRIYVDASAGGQGQTSKNPRVYVDLSTGTRVDVDDLGARSSTAWDLAIRRTVLWTNGGDGGPGQGAGTSIAKPFANVTDAEAKAKAPSLAPESFFDAECTPKTDPLGAPLTTFSSWYDYDEATNIPTPNKSTTYVIKGGTGKLFKVAIESYDALADGGSRNNASTGFFLLDVQEVL